jgi:hypothetical protein
MKFSIQVIVIAALAFALEMFLPWWSIAIAAAVGGYFVKSKANFFAGFMAIALLWMAYAFRIDSVAAVPLADKVAAIFSLTKMLLILVTGVLGGVIGGFAALAGSSLKKQRRSLYY